MKRKGFITEGEVALLLRRYSATTVLALFQEVAKCASAKIDWNSLVKNTATGITNAREYQMLWRHLAYRKKLAEKYEDDAQPLDDDSDLEFEIEPFPAVGADASAEATACVKVLATSSIPNNAGLPSHSTVEAPLTINIPSTTRVSDVQLHNQQSTISTQGMNITVPVSIQKQPLPTASSSEGIDGNVSTGSAQPVRKKRKLWTLEEDEELIAAVQKCGEGNWSSILKGAFKHDRTASQLSQIFLCAMSWMKVFSQSWPIFQRWALIRKRQVASNQGSLGNSTTLSGIVDTPQAATQVVPVAASTTVAISSTVTASTTMAVTANSTGPTAVTSCSLSAQSMGSSGPGISSSQPACVTGLDNFTSQLHQTQQTLEQGVVRGSNGSSNFSATFPPIKSRATPKKHAANAPGALSTGRLTSPAPPVTSVTSAPVTTVGRTETWQGPISTKTAVSLPVASSSSGRYGNAPAIRPGINEASGRGNLKTSSGPHPMVQAAAVAAGARIAPASAAASLLKAAQSGNVVHIGPGGVPLAKSGHPTQGGSVGGTTNSMRSSAGSVGSRASNVHYIRTGSIPSPPVYSGIMPSVQRLPPSQPKSHIGRAAAAVHSTHQLQRINLSPASTLPATQTLASSSASQSLPLNQTNQVACPLPLSIPLVTRGVRLKSQPSSSSTESSLTVQSETILKPLPIDTSFPALPAVSSADRGAPEQVALISSKLPVLPLAMEICNGVSSSLSASSSLSCPVVHPCEIADVPADLCSTSVFPEDTILMEDTVVHEVKIGELAKIHSLSTINTNFMQQPTCSQSNGLSESAIGIDCANIETNSEAHNKNNSEIDIANKSGGMCIPATPLVAAHQNVSTVAQNTFSDDPVLQSEK
eukprot:Gb_06202 [translate_table: standard]